MTTEAATIEQSCTDSALFPQLRDGFIRGGHFVRWELSEPRIADPGQTVRHRP